MRAYVLTGSEKAFAAGADIKEMLGMDYHEMATHDRDTSLLSMGALSAKKPVVGVVCGFAFGGGCEILLHCDAIQAHAELSIGLVETRIGVVPGWGGCKEMLVRQYGLAGGTKGPVAPAIATFNPIAPAQVSGSPLRARRPQKSRKTTAPSARVVAPPPGWRPSLTWRRY